MVGKKTKTKKKPHFIWVSLRTFCVVLVYPTSNSKTTTVFLFTIRAHNRVAMVIPFWFFMKNNRNLKGKKKKKRKKKKLNKNNCYIMPTQI